MRLLMIGFLLTIGAAVAEGQTLPLQKETGEIRLVEGTERERLEPPSDYCSPDRLLEGLKAAAEFVPERPGQIFHLGNFTPAYSYGNGIPVNPADRNVSQLSPDEMRKLADVKEKELEEAEKERLRRSKAAAQFWEIWGKCGEKREREQKD